MGLVEYFSERQTVPWKGLTFLEILCLIFHSQLQIFWILGKLQMSLKGKLN